MTRASFRRERACSPRRGRVVPTVRRRTADAFALREDTGATVIVDFLGWVDPSGSPRAHLVVERDGAPLGIMLRQSSGVGAGRKTTCQVCITSHSGNGVTLSVARKTGPAGKKGDSTGLYLCRDLACSLYVRGKKETGTVRLPETLGVKASVARLRRNLDQFVDRVAPANAVRR